MVKVNPLVSFRFVEQLVLEHNMWCHYFQEKLSDFLTDKPNPKNWSKMNS